MDELLTIVENYYMPYGKFKGESVGDIAKDNYDYLVWLSENSRDPIFKWALNKYLDSEKGY